MTYTMHTLTTYDGTEALGTFAIQPQAGCTDVRARLKVQGRPSVDLGLVACLPGTDLADAVAFVSRRSRIGFLSPQCLDSLTQQGGEDAMQAVRPAEGRQRLADVPAVLRPERPIREADRGDAERVSAAAGVPPHAVRREPDVT